jgi:hypothetical protein
VDGYLEGPDGPMGFHEVDWIEISPNVIKGGMAGRPLKMIDVKDEILAGLQEMQICWDLRQTTWSVERLFENMVVEVFRIVNPYPESSA